MDDFSFTQATTNMNHNTVTMTQRIRQTQLFSQHATPCWERICHTRSAHTQLSCPSGTRCNYRLNQATLGVGSDQCSLPTSWRGAPSFTGWLEKLKTLVLPSAPVPSGDEHNMSAQQWCMRVGSLLRTTSSQRGGNQSHTQDTAASNAAP